MGRTLHFQTILDSRFQFVNQEVLEEINKRLANALLTLGVMPAWSDVYPLDWPDCKQLRTNFYVKNPKGSGVTWNDVYGLVNETYKAVPYKFINR